MKYINNYCLFYNGPFSNWYPAEFDMYGNHFYTSEQAFMWQKALIFGDTNIADMIIKTESPENAKFLGRKVANYDDAYWSTIRYQVMVNVLKHKFALPKFAEILKEHAHLELVEASPYDTIWGIGLGEYDDRASDKNQWQGLNLLGKALNEVAQL